MALDGPLFIRIGVRPSKSATNLTKNYLKIDAIPYFGLAGRADRGAAKRRGLGGHSRGLASHLVARVAGARLSLLRSRGLAGGKV